MRIMYFGTTNGPGHSLTILEGNMSLKEQHRIADTLDGDEDLYSAMKKCRGVGYIYYRGVTMLCIPYSLHDSRQGSKSMFIMEGEVPMDEIIKELGRHSWVYNIFNKLIEKHLICGFEELKL